MAAKPIICLGYEINFEDAKKPAVEKTIKYISDESDPFKQLYVDEVQIVSKNK